MIELGDTQLAIEWLEGVGAMALREGDPRRGARLFGLADLLREDEATPVLPSEEEARSASLSELRGELGDDGFDAAWAEGRSVKWEEAVATALQ